MEIGLCIYSETGRWCIAIGTRATGHEILQNHSWYQRAAAPCSEASRNVSHRGTILETTTSMSCAFQETARDGGERSSGK